MYKEIFIALTKKQIKLLNASELAIKHNCSQSYVSRILKSTEQPIAPKAIRILASAYLLIDVFNKIETQPKN